MTDKVVSFRLNINALAVVKTLYAINCLDSPAFTSHRFLAYLPYLKKIKVGLCYHQAVCEPP
jgi:hypothetical protein